MIYGRWNKAEGAWNVEVEVSKPGERWLQTDTARQGQVEMVLYGRLLPGNGGGAEAVPTAASLLDRYLRHGVRAFTDLNGGFVAAILHRDTGELVLVRDHLGVEPLYYRTVDKTIEFSTSLRRIAGPSPFPEHLNHRALTNYLLLNYDPSSETLVEGVEKVPPGTAIRLVDGSGAAESYWRPDYSTKLNGSEDEIVRSLREVLDRAVRIRVEHDRSLGFSVSGGMDSSTVLGLASRYVRGDFYAFSFRCAVESYDESRYSSLVANHYGARYEQVEYLPEKALLAAEMVRAMEEPQADLGIEVATYLLGRHAENKIDLLLTGDGGDELFAGHPVYLADRAARTFERVPRFLRSPVAWFASFIPESAKKNAFTVKLKRFVEGQRFPRIFHSNRWRIYYTPELLRSLLTEGTWEKVGRSWELRWLRELYEDLSWDDELDRSLYGDYFTVVQFYLRRLSLLRAFGIEARCPLLDPQVVDFCARIPNELKIPNSKEQKYIQKRAMEGILPDAIVHRKDKLGHSVPMRKWLREERALIESLENTLGDSSLLAQWGIVRTDTVRRFLREYLSGKQNHAHRLWALYVLELWFRSW